LKPGKTSPKFFAITRFIFFLKRGLNKGDFRVRGKPWEENMQGHELIWYLIVGLLTGWLASLLVQGRGMGAIADVVVGILGAVIGGFLADELDIQVGGFFSALGISLIGAVLLLLALRVVMPSRRNRKLRIIKFR
jgi:uncharacterized membrane protein YeaQ/YmgE (transglycosylase-associated protein family)